MLAACGVSDVYFTVVFLCTGQIKLSIEDPVEVGQRAVIVVGSTLATNLLSTGLIAWKAWCVPLPSDPRQLSLTMSLA